VQHEQDGHEDQLQRIGVAGADVELDARHDREGLAREIVHAVQLARRDAGLDISDRIDLALGGDETLLGAARAHEEYISGEVLALTVAYAINGTAETASIEGRELRISVTPV
jgi:isoleucyl-tRNA synthetase